MYINLPFQHHGQLHGLIHPHSSEAAYIFGSPSELQVWNKQICCRHFPVSFSLAIVRLPLGAVWQFQIKKAPTWSGAVKESYWQHRLEECLDQAMVWLCPTWMLQRVNVAVYQASYCLLCGSSWTKKTFCAGWWGGSERRLTMMGYSDLWPVN